MDSFIWDFNRVRFAVAEKTTIPGRNQPVPAVFSPEVIIFPRMQVTLALGEEHGVEAVSRAVAENRLIAFIPAEYEELREGLGVLTLVLSTEKSPDGLRADLRGLWRVKVSNPGGLRSGPSVMVEKLDEPGEPEDSSTIDRVHAQLDEFRELLPDIPPEIMSMLSEAKSASELSDLCAMSPTLSHQERLDLLGTLDPGARLKKVSRHFDKELEMLKALAKTRPIMECETCTDLADRAFDAEPAARAEAIAEFLNHVVSNHTAELLNLIAEKYGPAFMRKRSLR